MKTIGIVGGIAPESTIEYYRFILARYRDRVGDGSAPTIVINSIDLKKMLQLVATDPSGLVQYLSDSIETLAKAGADFAALASNTPHIVFDELRRNSRMPLISIVESTCVAAANMNLKKLALFGTKFTMQGTFYPDVFTKHEISIVQPQQEEQEYIHGKYMKELVNAVFLQETRQGLLNIIQTMAERHQIDGVILGGTELPLILRDASTDVPLLDTTKIHVEAIVEELLS